MEKKKAKILGIISLICGIASLFTMFWIVPGIIFEIVAIILGIVAIVKKENIAMPIIGIVLSGLSMIVTMGLILFAILTPEGTLVKSYNTLAEGNTDKVKIENKLEGHKWKMTDGSLLELKSNGVYYWYQDADNLTDNYFYGTYTTKVGDDAIDSINKITKFNEEYFSNNNKVVLRTDVYYLELNKISTVISKNANSTIQKSYFCIGFYKGSSTNAACANLNSLSEIYMTRYD